MCAKMAKHIATISEKVILSPGKFGMEVRRRRLFLFEAEVDGRVNVGGVILVKPDLAEPSKNGVWLAIIAAISNRNR